MTTFFPINLDSITDPTAGNATVLPTDANYGNGHSKQHKFANDAIKALEAKVGVDSSADTTSHDYKLSSITGSEKAVSSDLSTIPDSSTSTKGVVKLSVAPALATSPIAVGDNDGRIPSQGENDAMAGSYGTPSSSNKFVTETDPNIVNSVLLTTDQTIAGIKTFSSIPVLPASDPTTANQAARKSYVDGLVAETTGSITITSEGALGSGTVYYKKRGKLYYDIYFASGGGISTFFEDSTSMTRIMTAVGGIAGTPNAQIQNYGAYTYAYSGGTWSGNAPGNSTRNICSSFLGS